MDWQPIESAPRDGSQILAVYEDRVYVARWTSVWIAGNEMWVADVPFSDPPTVASIGPELDSEGKLSLWGKAGPTHWMPRPPPPVQP